MLNRIHDTILGELTSEVIKHMLNVDFGSPAASLGALSTADELAASNLGPSFFLLA